MLNQIEQDPATPYLMDPQNVPAWANLFIASFDRLWSQLAGRVNNLLPNDGSEGRAWTAYTPSLAANSGTFTSASANGRYYKVGRIVFFQANVIITTNGTAAGSIVLGLPPFTCASNIIFTGRGDAVSGKMLQGVVHTGQTQMNIFNYDNTYPGATGESIIIGGHYEATT